MVVKRFVSLGVIALVSGALLFSAPTFSAEPVYQDPAWPKTDFNKTSVDLSEIMSGGPPKDGIPSIDSPKFVSIKAASEWLHLREPVIALEINGQAKAYPLQILTWHEIVNDSLGGIPVSVTFCPLCNASIVFDRRIDGKVLDFGTTGRLRKSDMVMYDRQTETWWQQFIGEGIVGEMTGVRLKQVDSQIIAFEDFAKAYPSAEVLSQDTGHLRSYGTNPYAGYDNINSFPFLFRGDEDPRLPPMERVLAVKQDGRHILFPFSILEKQALINQEGFVVFSPNKVRSALDQREIASSRDIAAAAAFKRSINGKELTFEFKNNQLVDKETGSTWNLLGRAVAGQLKGQQLIKTDAGVHFAFAWLAFDVKADIYKAGK